jgi:hypothetical protein
MVPEVLSQLTTRLGPPTTHFDGCAWWEVSRGRLPIRIELNAHMARPRLFIFNPAGGPAASVVEIELSSDDAVGAALEKLDKLLEA